MNHTLYTLGKDPISPRMFIDSIYEDLVAVRNATSGGSASLYEKAFSIAIVVNDPYAFDTQVRSSRTVYSVLNVYTPSFLDKDIELISRYLYQKLRLLHTRFNTPDAGTSTPVL